jgi:AraC-like DNA-binding protein
MKNEYIQSRNNLVVEQTLKCIKECEDQETLSIDQIASAMHHSPSSITHILKQQTGFSFKQLHIDYRLRLAEDLMRKRFDLTLQEIAQMAGFNDPFYFSRIYKKYRGYPPSRFRSRG